MPNSLAEHEGISKVSEELSGFVHELHQTRSYLSGIEAVPTPFKEEERQHILMRLEQMRSAIPALLTALAELPAYLEAVPAYLNAVEEKVQAYAFPQGPVHGISYNDPIPKGEMTNRAYNALVGGGITTMGALCAMQARECILFRNLGRDSLSSIEQYRIRLGVPLV